MSDDPLDETIRGKQDKLTIDGVDAPVFAHEGVPPNAIYTVDELKRKIAESKAKTAGLHQFMVDEEKRQGELILIDTRTLYSQAQLDAFKRIGFGTCHIQGPDGKMRLVSVSVVSPQRDPFEAGNAMKWQGIEYKDGAGRPLPFDDTEFSKSLDAHGLRFVDAEREWDGRGAMIHDGEGNLIVDDLNAIQPDETARRGMYASWPDAPDFRAIRSTTLIEQYAELQESATVVGAWLRQDLRDLWTIVRGWFGRK